MRSFAKNRTIHCCRRSRVIGHFWGRQSEREPHNGVKSFLRLNLTSQKSWNLFPDKWFVKYAVQLKIISFSGAAKPSQYYDIFLLWYTTWAMCGKQMKLENYFDHIVDQQASKISIRVENLDRTFPIIHPGIFTTLSMSHIRPWDHDFQSFSPASQPLMLTL